MTIFVDGCVSEEEIDAGAKALRARQMSGKKLNDWATLPSSTKRKWRDHAACVLTAALSARQLKAASK